MVQKVIVFGKELDLPVEVHEEDIKENLLGTLREVDSETAQEVENTEYDTRVEDNKLVVYRRGAVFG